MLYDSLLVTYLARELDARLRGRPCAGALAFPGDRQVVFALSDGRAIKLDLHPSRGWIREVPWEPDPEPDAICEAVTAPADERLLLFSLRSTDRFQEERREIIVELQTNQWNALLVGEDRRILSVAWSRSAGDRSLRSGTVYPRQIPQPRFGVGSSDEAEAWERWSATLQGVPPEQRRSVMLSQFAYTGTPNAEYVLGEASTESGKGSLRAAFERWWWLRSLPTEDPILLRLGSRTIPYPLPVGPSAGQPIGSLLEGMDRIAAVEGPATEPLAETAEIEASVRTRIAAIGRRIRSLGKEQVGSESADAVRASADLLLAKLHEVPRGASEVELQDWAGSSVTIPLDPSLSAADNAAALYEEARRRTRGAARVQRMLEEAEIELDRWETALSSISRGSVPPWVERELESSQVSGQGRKEGPVLPYRVFRTSGGLEVRVGRNARRNDELTFRHSAPDDVWLHAQSVPGSHVILRWPDANGAPPARDLAEAATLAAFNSRARSSGLVAVDWTRRKYVRKPRGSPPGTVTIQRVKTVFVEPDQAIVDRLKEG